MFLFIQFQLQNEVDLPATGSLLFVIYDDECNVLTLMNTMHLNIERVTSTLSISVRLFRGTAVLGAKY